ALNLEILCRCFALARDFLVLDNLPFIETGEAGSLDSRDMDELIFAAALRLNESVPFLGVEPLHGDDCHFQSPLWNMLRCPYVLGVRSAPGGSRPIDIHQSGLTEGVYR